MFKGVRAGFTDPDGPKVWRVIPYALPVFALLFAIFGPLSGTPAVTIGLASVALFHAIGLFDLRQRQPRTAELECGPGYIRIENAGSRNQRIHVKDITGGTTARTKSGLLLTLQHRHREQPITLEVESDADANKVRHALGIGHDGFGVVCWRTHNHHNQRGAFIGRIMALVWALATTVVTLSSSDAGAILGLALGIFAFVGALLGLVGLTSTRFEPSIVMAANGLRLASPRGWFSLPYEAVHRVEDHGHAIAFTVPEPYRSVVIEHPSPWRGGPSENDRRVIVSQIKAAAQRAHGFGQQKNDVVGRVDVLLRKGESARDWLVRLDMAGQLLSAGPGYRGNALDLEDLWTILEDPDADADLRAAAARVLRHAPASGVRLRIDAAVAAVRDESTSRRLRIAIRDDLDAASQELAFLDATEPRSSAPLQAAVRGRTMHGR